MKLVPFETAKKLADKGFDKPTLLSYNDNGIIPKLLPDVFEPSENIYRAPNIYEVMEWLKEHKKIFIASDFFIFNFLGCSQTYWVVTIKNIINGSVYNCLVCKESSQEQSIIDGINYVLDNNLI
jgi:hypothetical protein